MDATPVRNERDLFNEIEGNRPQLNAGVVSQARERDENYPLRELGANPEVLLVSYSDLKPVIEGKIGYKCEESQMETMAIEKIEEAIFKYTSAKRPFYKFIIVDLDDVTIIIDRFGRKIKKLLLDANIKTDRVVLYAFSSIVSDNLLSNCKKAGFRHYYKPSKLQALDVLRQLSLIHI